MNKLQFDKAKQFYDMHKSENCFLMPNVWDAGSAKLLASIGFKCLGTTSAGIAFSLGQPDNVFCNTENRVSRDDMLNQIKSITEAVQIPVSADLEGGFGDSPETVAETVKMAINNGIVGANIEDYTGNIDNPIYEKKMAVDRIKAARKEIDDSNIPVVLVGRTDYMNIDNLSSLDKAIERANQYGEAGADCLFIPGVSDSLMISILVKELNAPINVVMGLTGSQLSYNELKDLGVRRISIGGSLARSMYYHMRNAAQEIFNDGTFSYANEQIPQNELNDIFESNL